jgi:hypothetical protein
MVARSPTVADHGVFVHANQSARFPHAAPFGDVGEDGDDFVLRQAGVEQGGAFALGETGFAGLAIQQAALLRAIARAHGEIAVPALAVVGTVRVLAAKGQEGIHGGNALPFVHGMVKGVQLL